MGIPNDLKEATKYIEQNQTKLLESMQTPLTKPAQLKYENRSMLEEMAD